MARPQTVVSGVRESVCALVSQKKIEEINLDETSHQIAPDLSRVFVLRTFQMWRRKNPLPVPISVAAVTKPNL